MKRNRAPRIEISPMYLDPGEIIPGTDRHAERAGWHYPEEEEGFTRPKYTEWRRRQREKWEEEHQEKTVPVVVRQRNFRNGR